MEIQESLGRMIFFKITNHLLTLTIISHCDNYSTYSRGKKLELLRNHSNISGVRPPFLHFCAPKQPYVIIKWSLTWYSTCELEPIPERVKVGMVTLTLPPCHNMELGSELDPVPVVAVGEPLTCIFVPQKHLHVIIKWSLTWYSTCELEPIPERVKVGMVTLTLPSCHNMESGSELDPVPAVAVGEPHTCIFVFSCNFLFSM